MNITPVAFVIIGFVAALTLLTGGYMVHCGVEKFARRLD